MRASLPTEEENLKVTSQDPTLREVTNETCGKEFSLGKESKKLKSENKSTTSPGGIWWVKLEIVGIDGRVWDGDCWDLEWSSHQNPTDEIEV